MKLSLRLVVIHGEYSFAICVGDDPVIAFGSYKRAVLELRSAQAAVDEGFA